MMKFGVSHGMFVCLIFFLESFYPVKEEDKIFKIFHRKWKWRQTRGTREELQKVCFLRKRKNKLFYSEGKKN